jgi:1,4-alpha-glucan branching enzyme
MPDKLSHRPWHLRFGASVLDEGHVEFRVWAPNLTSLSVRILGDRPTIPMTMPHLPNVEFGSEFVANVPNIGEG